MAKSFYSHNGITIYHGDCREILPGLKDVGMVFTSPPYNLGSSPWPQLGHWQHGKNSGGNSRWRNGCDAGRGVRYGVHKDDMPWPEYEKWQREILALCWATLSVDGAIFYQHKPRVIGGRLWTPLALIPSGLHLRQIIVWARSGGINLTPVSFVSTHEWILLLAKDEFRLRDRSASGIGDTWNVSQSPSEHPAPFPLGLPRRAIETTVATTILDPFMGSGTTLRAAKDLGRKAIGIELEERYCEIAAKRLAQEVLDFEAPPAPLPVQP